MIYFLTTYRINLSMLKDIMLKHNLEVNYFAFTQKYNCIIITSVICICKGGEVKESHSDPQIGRHFPSIIFKYIIIFASFHGHFLHQDYTFALMKG